MNTLILCRAVAPAALTLAVFSFSGAHAAGEHSDGHGGHHSAMHGQPAKASEASRTVEVSMKDNFYEPEEIEVKAGETVRFVVSNDGELVHEFNVATPDMHAAHQDEMQMMVEHGVLKASSIDMAAAEQMMKSMGHGKHDDPNSVLLEPGETGEVVWTFPSDGTLEFACNVPGHYEAGMVGDIEITGN